MLPDQVLKYPLGFELDIGINGQDEIFARTRRTDVPVPYLAPDAGQLFVVKLFQPVPAVLAHVLVARRDESQEVGGELAERIEALRDPFHVDARDVQSFHFPRLFLRSFFLQGLVQIPRLGQRSQEIGGGPVQDRGDLIGRLGGVLDDLGHRVDQREILIGHRREQLAFFVGEINASPFRLEEALRRILRFRADQVFPAAGQLDVIQAKKQRGISQREEQDYGCEAARDHLSASRYCGSRSLIRERASATAFIRSWSKRPKIRSFSSALAVWMSWISDEAWEIPWFKFTNWVYKDTSQAAENTTSATKRTKVRFNQTFE